MHQPSTSMSAHFESLILPHLCEIGHLAQEMQERVQAAVLSAVQPLMQSVLHAVADTCPSEALRALAAVLHALLTHPVYAQQAQHALVATLESPSFPGAFCSGILAVSVTRDATRKNYASCNLADHTCLQHFGWSCLCQCAYIMTLLAHAVGSHPIPSCRFKGN